MASQTSFRHELAQFVYRRTAEQNAAQGEKCARLWLQLTEEQRAAAQLADLRVRIWAQAWALGRAAECR
jgi:hypothetical protein